MEAGKSIGMNWQINKVVFEVLSCLKHFMSESCSEMLEESTHLAEAGTSNNPKKKKATDAKVNATRDFALRYFKLLFQTSALLLIKNSPSHRKRHTFGYDDFIQSLKCKLTFVMS